MTLAEARAALNKANTHTEIPLKEFVAMEVEIAHAEAHVTQARALEAISADFRYKNFS